MIFYVSPPCCDHPDRFLRLAVDNRNGHRSIVLCEQCRSTWTAETLPVDLLDRCLEYFEAMKG